MACVSYTKKGAVEAIDGVGRWGVATVQDVGVDTWFVSFDGWSSRFSRWVKRNEIRSRQNEEASAGRTRRDKRRAASKLSNLEAGDYIDVKSHGGDVVQAEVLIVDPINGNFNCLLDGQPTLLTEDDIHCSEIGPKLPSRQHHAKRLKRSRINATTTLATPATPEPVLHVPVQIPEPDPVQTTTHHDAMVKVNQDGCLVQGGDIYSIGENNISVGVQRVTSDFNAVGKLIVGNEFRTDIEIRLCVDLLSDSSVRVGRAAQRELSGFTLFNQHETIRHAPVHVRLGVRRALLGKSLLKEIRLGLKSKSFQRYFSLGTVCPEFDVEVLNLGESHRVEYSHSKHNLDRMDSVLGTSWDIRKCSDQSTFVTKLVLRVKDLQLVGKVWCALCREALPTNYRTFLSTYEVPSVPDSTPEDAHADADDADFDW